MKELDFIKIINKITKSQHIGDDCAYLKELGIVVTQDNFIEDVHFKKNWVNPYQIGYKAAAVNISDILASGGKPEYLTIGLSLPEVDDKFIEELYKGIIAGSYGAKIAGGDITGADKIFISIAAIGSTNGRKISSRANAKIGYKVITIGEFGSSSYGLNCLFNNQIEETELIKSHLEPTLYPEFSEQIAKNIKEDYAMMDTSDGLADALFKIADLSNVTLNIDYDKIPHNNKINNKKDILFGAEDYNPIAVVPETVLQYLDKYSIIGEAVEKIEDVKLITDGVRYSNNKDLDLYNHFGE